MAEVRKAKPATSQAAGKKKPEPKRQPAATGVDAIRTELGKARRDHRMQQLDSPAKLRQLRRTLARELTKDRAARLQQPKEANG